MTSKGEKITPRTAKNTGGVVHSNRKRPQAFCLARYVFRYINRALLRTLLTLLVSAGFMFTLGWMQWTIEQNTLELDRLYVTTTVEGEIVQSNSSVSHGGVGIVSRGVVDTILESGFVQSIYLEASSHWFIYDPFASEEADSFIVYGFDQPEVYFAEEENRFYTSSELAIVDEYVEGWDESFFSENWTEENTIEGVPTVVPDLVLQELGLTLGDTVRIQKKAFDNDGKVVRLYIVGRSNNADNILVPLSALNWMDGEKLHYTVVEFVFDPAKNRELPDYTLEMEELISQSDAGITSLRLLLWDEELRSVIKPLEENLSLMAVLYPVTVAISMLIAVGLNFLLVNLLARDTAILRVLGVSRIEALISLTGQQALLSLVGVIAGLAGLAALWSDLFASISSPSLTAGGLYLISAIIGAIVGGIIITRRQPLELLQVKE
jgi:hypothetical protein